MRRRAADDDIFPDKIADTSQGSSAGTVSGRRARPRIHAGPCRADRRTP